MRKISIVIPVYNEKERLAACLEAIKRQSVKPLEVIVVDNNSTDGTAAVASRFPFVTVLHEPRQGVVHARNRGFDAARGEIIGRIDADTLLPADWVRKVEILFGRGDIAALSGAITYYDVAGQTIINAADRLLRGWLSRQMRDCQFLLGSNMAIRRSAWEIVSAQTCTHSAIHEDLDLAVHLAHCRLKVYYAPQLLAGTSGRRICSRPKTFMLYLLQSPWTYARHNRREHYYMYPVMFWVAVFYGPLRLCYRGFDETTQRFNWRQLLGSEMATSRVNPATFVE